MNEPDPNELPTRTIAPPSLPSLTSSAAGTMAAVPAGTATPSATPQARIGEYVLLGELGHGGMGIVYRAEDRKLKREVAVKVMLPQFAANPTAKARFVREARAQAKVEHDHVAAIFTVDDHEGLPYIVMPLLKGMTLQAALRANPRPPLPEVIRMGREMAEGLAAAHEKGLVHRDIKPANVWLEGKKLRVKVLDFGLARTTAEVEATEGSEGPVTNEGAIVGTPAYMSPEQGRGLPVDGRTDLWSLGVVLYQMTAGELPFRGATSLAVITALAFENPAPPITKNPAVPQPLSDFIMRLLAKDPAYRPPTADHAADELRAIETGLVNTVRVIALDSPPPIILQQSGPDPFTDLDATEVNSVPDAEPVGAEEANRPVTRREPKKSSGGFPIWLVAGVLLAVAVIVGLVVSQMGKKPEPEVAKVEPPVLPPPPSNKGTPKPKESNLTGADREALEALHPLVYLMFIRPNGEQFEIRPELPFPDELPPLQRIRKLNIPPRLVADFPARVIAALPRQTALEEISDGQFAVTWTDSDIAKLAELPCQKTLRSLSLCADLTPKTLESLQRFPRLKLFNGFNARNSDDSVLLAYSKLGLAPDGVGLSIRDLGQSGTVTEKGWEAIATLPVYSLTLWNPKGPTGPCCQLLSRMPKLVVLSIQGGELDADGLQALSKCSQLRRFQLTDTKVAPNALKHLTAVSGLDNLSLTRVALTEDDVSWLAEMKNLRTLGLVQTKLDTPAVAERLSAALPRCTIGITQKTYEPRDPHVREANRLLARGGISVGVQQPGKDELIVTDASELPNGPFTLVRVKIVGPSAEPFSDDDLKKLEATPTLVALELTGAAITDAGFRSVLASKASLKALYLHGCPLTDKSLATIGELPNIESVAIGTWNITDDGVKHLSGLKKLHTAGIGVTPITDACLKHLIGVPLKRLILDESAISDAGVPTLSKMTQLEDLSLRATRVTKTGYEQLKKALLKCAITWEDPNRTVATMLLTRPDQARLQVTLELPDGKQAVVEKVDDLPKGSFLLVGFYRHGGPNALNESELRALATIPTLKTFNYPHLAISPVGLRSLLPSKKALSGIYLAQSHLTDEHLQVIGELTALTSINLGTTVSSITDEGLAHLAGLTKLEAIFLNEFALTDAGLKHLTKFSQLTHLGIGMTLVSDAGIESLAKMKSLRYLDVKRTRISRAGFERLQKELPNCKIEWEDPNRVVALWALEQPKLYKLALELPGGKTVVALSKEDIPAGPFTITQFLGHGAQFSDADVRRLGGLNGLTVLILGGNNTISDAGVRDLLHLKDTLEAIDPRAVTDAGMETLAKFSQLKSLSLGSAVTDRGIKHLASLPKLEALLLFNSNVSDASVEVLAKIPKLTTLHLEGTRITDAGYKKLKDALPNCKIMWEAKNPAPAANSPEARAILNAVLAAGGKLVVQIGDESQAIGPKDSLPAGPFVVRDMVLTALPVGELRDLPAVTGKLQVTFLECNDEALARLAGIPGLASITEFALSASDVTGVGFQVLRQFPELTSVSVVYSPKVGGDLSSLAELSKLKTLNFMATSVDRASLASIAKTKVETLIIRECKIDDAALPELASMTPLRNLAVVLTPGVTEAGLKKLALSLPSCRIAYGDSTQKVIEPTQKP